MSTVEISPLFAVALLMSRDPASAIDATGRYRVISSGEALSALIKGAREARLASFQECQYCGRRTAPEYLHDTGVCQGCTDRHSGAIH